jgi:hypothetical protein
LGECSGGRKGRRYIHSLSAPAYTKGVLSVAILQLFYPVVLFLHILSVLGAYIAVGLEWTMLQRMRRARGSAGS